MANAIHKTEPHETLVAIGAQYYAPYLPDGRIDAVALKKVTAAIRIATPPDIFKLDPFGDDDPLPKGSTLFVPTLRDLNRVVFTDKQELVADLKDKGFNHARKLLRYKPQQVIDFLSPLKGEYAEEDIRRAWTLTAFCNLDGMDRYTAQHLYDVAKIQSLKELARQTPSAIEKMLATLVYPPHERPAALQDQRHAERWPLEAKILTRKRVSELTKAKAQMLQVPFAPAAAQQQAEFYEAATRDDSLPSKEAALASKLSKLYRFQAAVLRGNLAVWSGQWAVAVDAYQEARRYWHRLAEETGAIDTVNDADGINLITAIAVTRRLLDAIPGEEDQPLGASPMKLRSGGRNPGYRLRSFRYDELHSGSQQELRAQLSSRRVHQLPRKLRSAIQQAVLEKTRAELESADARLIEGLVQGAGTTLMRDLERQDREVLRRNLGSTAVDVLYAEAPKTDIAQSAGKAQGGRSQAKAPGNATLDVFDAVGDSFAISDVDTLALNLWKNEKVDTLLSETAKTTYPNTFLHRDDITPFTKFIVLPGKTGSENDTFIPLAQSFGEDYENILLKPRLMSGDGNDIAFNESCWTSAGTFAAIAPHVYAVQLPMGMRKAYTQLGQRDLAGKYGGMRVNVYGKGGILTQNIAAADPSSLAYDFDLYACSTTWEPEPGAYVQISLHGHARDNIDMADQAYRQDDRETARSWYADITCAIEFYWGETNTAFQAQLALTGVHNSITAINAGQVNASLQSLSTLNIVYVDNGVTHKVLEDHVLVTAQEPLQVNQNELTVQRAVQRATSGKQIAVEEATFDWNTVSVATDIAIADREIQIGSLNRYYVNEADDIDTEIYAMYLYCLAQIEAIDAGLNWYGYSDAHIPPWSFEHLYSVARDLCNRTLDAEQRVFSLLQLFEAAKEKEFLANQGAELTYEQLAVAESRVEEQTAANDLASAQAAHSETQARAQKNKSAVEAGVAVANTTIHLGLTIGGLIAGGPIGAIAGNQAAKSLTGQSSLQSAESTTIAVNNHVQDEKVLDAAEEVTAATSELSQAAMAVAIAERDVAALQAEQASDYLSFLLDAQVLNSEGYAYLLNLAREVYEVYVYHANRLSWLAERALEHETRKSFDLVGVNYTTGNELTDMTRAQRLTADLEALRSNYAAGQSVRLQEVKWTIALSQLDPIAWQDLRETGSGTFVLRQRDIDMFFPGMYLHRLKDVSMAIIGLVPPEGARGILTNPGVSWVRVPNLNEYLTGETEPDWTTTSLENSATFDPYDVHVMKQLVSNMVVLSLSQFDVRSDRVVLSSPQGMLKPVEHLGLDAAWTLKLHRQSNNFDFRNIIDIEFTFWFLCAYDPDLEDAQANALIEDGAHGKLTGTAVTAFAFHQPEAWTAFISEPVNREALDVRLLTLDVGELTLMGSGTQAKNILIACARLETQTSEISLRLLCDHDPVGYKFTTTGAIYSLLGVDTSEENPPPEPDADFEAWIKESFYRPLGKISVPSESPEVRWVIKATPVHTGAGWVKEDEDGNAMSTSSGPLLGSHKGSTSCIARYNDGETWTDIVLKTKVAHQDGTLRLHLRDNGSDHYALEISPHAVRLLKREGGTLTELGVQSLAYPHDEYVCVEFSIVDQDLSAQIDGIKIFDQVDGQPAVGQLTSGTIALEVTNTDRETPAEFDDVEVVRLTGMGAEAETLLSEPFTGKLPADWTFQNGASPWRISPTGHRQLDLSTLLNIVINLEYLFEMELN